MTGSNPSAAGTGGAPHGSAATPEVATSVAGILEPETDDFSHLLDSTLVAYDGVSLGKVNRNPFDSESMVNEFGPHGSQFETRSIFNQFSTYGNSFSSLSPYNEFSRQAPRFVKNGKVLGTLTVNTFVQNRIAPEKFVEWLKSGS